LVTTSVTNGVLSGAQNTHTTNTASSENSSSTLPVTFSHRREAAGAAVEGRALAQLGAVLGAAPRLRQSCLAP
jgi:hypothetical protein